VNRTLERLERVLTMVPWLLEHQGASLDDLAERFTTSPEEVAEDLDILGYCGLPGYGGGDLVEVSVVGGRVTIRMAEFFRRPLRLSMREAVTLLLAGQVVAGVPGMSESASLRSAVAKLQDLVGPGLDGTQVAVDLSAPGDELLPVLRDAIEQRRVVRLEYRSAAGTDLTTRDVEPLAIIGTQGAWYLHAHCRLAGGPRDFRLDRIKEATLTGEEVTVDPTPHPPPPVYEPAADDLAVMLDLEPAAWWILDWAVVDEVEERRSTRRIRLRARSLDWAARLVLSLAGSVRVVGPDQLAVRMQELAEQTLDRYRDPNGSFS
jgi:predicted DNA-binding transcriptional regulator YafY